MIPHLDTLINMQKANELSMDEFVTYIIKNIAQNGTKDDFISLTTEIKNEISKKIEWYKENRSWIVVSSNGLENYKQYAEDFLKKIE